MKSALFTVQCTAITHTNTLYRGKRDGCGENSETVIVSVLFFFGEVLLNENGKTIFKRSDDAHRCGDI